MAIKRVLVTGSSRGIGKAVALRLAEDGWSVAIHYTQAKQEAEATANELARYSAGVYQADLGDLEQAKKLVGRVLEDGPLHAVVNNAGVYLTLDFAGATAENFETTYHRCMRVNFESPAWIVREASRHFIEQGNGKVVNVCSRVGHRGEPGASFYSVSKAALLNLTRALSVEHAPHNVQHFAIAPGWVETAMVRQDMDKRLPEILSGIPLGRVASVHDCAAAVAFLLRDEASYLSGTTIDINGASYIR